MQGKLTVNTVAPWAWYWLHGGGMVTFYMVYGQMHWPSCALYYCNDRHSHHSLYLCNLYHLQFCQEHVFSFFSLPPASFHTQSRSFKWGHPSCSCWPTWIFSQRACMLARWLGRGGPGFWKQSQTDQVKLTWDTFDWSFCVIVLKKKKKRVFCSFKHHTSALGW